MQVRNRLQFFIFLSVCFLSCSFLFSFSGFAVGVVVGDGVAGGRGGVLLLLC